MPNDIEHLLRRCEYVARPARVAELSALGSRSSRVDDVLDVPADPGTIPLSGSSTWQRGVSLTEVWLDRMAHDSPRPVQERMAFFWHGHFCSELGKVGSAEVMRQQIDLFRHQGLGNLRSLTKSMSTQVAMLRYLDNNRNRSTSPNQNFARELLELFLLGVGNYVEDDVEAGTAAWTGHTDTESDTYAWKSDWHDGSVKSFLGRTINAGADATRHGEETIDVVLDTGTVPAGAAVVANRGRPTRDVAAEFLSRKLWLDFAGTEPPPAVMAAMRATALANDFAIRPWLRTMLLRDEFYTDEVKRGRVRSPVEFVVALLAATGLRADASGVLWLLQGMGQRPLYPPDVSGWKHNDYWINASAMARRATAARSAGWRTMTGYWEGDGLIHLGAGTLSRNDFEHVYRDDPAGLVDRLLDVMDLSVTATTRSALVDFASASQWWERNDLVSLILMSPDLHVA